MKLDIDKRRKTVKFRKFQNLNNTSATNDSKKKSQGKLENTLR